jgi:ribosomal protein L11 methyltransferase
VRSYLTVTCRLQASAEEALAASLNDWPVLGCQVETRGAEINVAIYLDNAKVDAVPEILAGLALLDAAEVAVGSFAERDWLEEYRKNATPLPIGRRLWVDPSPAAPTAPPDGRLHIVVEPRQAFGTGSHESTRLVLEVLEELPLAGRSVLDVGCGSGILALAALALGARRAVAFDIDGAAVFVARQTIAVQPVVRHVELFAGTSDALTSAATFDLVLANMIPAEFLPFLARLRDLVGPGGDLVLSGVMADQREVVEAELATCRMQVTAAHRADEWLALVCRPQFPCAVGTPRTMKVAAERVEIEQRRAAQLGGPSKQ